MHKINELHYIKKIGKGIQFNYITSKNTLKHVSGIPKCNYLCWNCTFSRQICDMYSASTRVPDNECILTIHFVMQYFKISEDLVAQ